MELAKIVYSFFIQHDPAISGTVVRSTTIPEDLGRVSYLLTDKTGTLTQNLMTFKRLFIGGNRIVGKEEAQRALNNALCERVCCEIYIN